MNVEKEAKLDTVGDAAERYREAQHAALVAREEFIDAIVDSTQPGPGKATQQEIADRCVIEPGSDEHLSRQRVAQFINERRSPRV